MFKAWARHFFFFLLLLISFNLTIALPDRLWWAYFRDGKARFREVKGNTAKSKQSLTVIN